MCMYVYVYYVMCIMYIIYTYIKYILYIYIYTIAEIMRKLVKDRFDLPQEKWDLISSTLNFAYE